MAKFIAVVNHAGLTLHLNVDKIETVGTLAPILGREKEFDEEFTSKGCVTHIVTDNGEIISKTSVEDIVKAIAFT